MSLTGLCTELMRDSMIKYPDLDDDIWCKMFYMEKNQLVAKAYVSDWELIVDNSSQEYDGIVIGLNTFANPGRDKGSAETLKKIDKGVKIARDKEGNIFASQLGDCEIIVKGHTEPDLWCISEEIQANQGRLKKKPSTIFDMQKYKKLIESCENIAENRLKLHVMSMVSFSFAEDSTQFSETPCWIILLNFAALKVLHKEKGSDTGLEQKTEL